MRIELPFRAPSVNTYWRRGKFTTYLSPKGREFKESVKRELFQKFGKIEIMTGRLKVTIALNYKGKRKFDIDNYNKAILDSLNGIVFEDDEQIDMLIVTKKYNCVDDGVVVIVSTCEN